jgi:hypothetical protein
MTLIKTAREAVSYARNPSNLVNKIWAELLALDTRVTNSESGIVAAGSISSDELANGAVVEAKLGTGAVTSGKVANGAISAAKTDSTQKSGLGSGTGLAVLTSNFGDPSTLVDGSVFTFKDTNDANAGYVITVSNGVFQKSLKLTPVTA